MISYEEPTVEVLAMHNIASVSIVTSRARAVLGFPKISMLCFRE